MSDGRPVRLLDLGAVPPLRSQALYHALGEGMSEEAPDTLVLCRPAAPYFCVGHHQVAADELDLGWCRARGYPVLQRRTGGGTVYLDPAQLFYQCVFHRRRAPFAVEAIYRRFLTPPVEVLRGLGLPAALEGVNEIEVGGRRIAGTGGGQMGEAVVVTGNLLFDFDYGAMARAWRVPSEPFRRLAAAGLRRYLTTLRRELPRCPPVQEVAGRLAAQYARTLERPLEPGGLTPREEAAVARVEGALAARAARPARRPDRELKIAREAYVREARVPTPGGPLRLALLVRDGRIEDLAVTGLAGAAGHPGAPEAEPPARPARIGGAASA